MMRSYPIFNAASRRELVNMSHVIAACKANLKGEAEQHAANHSGAGLRPLMVIFLSALYFGFYLTSGGLDAYHKRVVGVSQRLTEEVNYCLPLTCSLCEQEKGKERPAPVIKRGKDGVQK